MKFKLPFGILIGYSESPRSNSGSPRSVSRGPTWSREDELWIYPETNSEVPLDVWVTPPHSAISNEEEGSAPRQESPRDFQQAPSEQPSEDDQTLGGETSMGTAVPDHEESE